MLRIGAHNSPRSQFNSLSTPPGGGGSKKYSGFDPGKTLGQKQWTNRDEWQPSKNLVASGNTSHAQIDGNQSSSYVSGELNGLEFRTGTGFTEDGTGAGFEASLAELQGDARFRFSPNGLTMGAGGELNLASLRGDAGFGHDLGDIVDGKLYAGAHGEMLVGANADANFSLNLNPLKGKLGAKGEVGGLLGAEASATAKGELGALGGTATAGAIAGLAGAAGGDVGFKDGKLTFGLGAKLALGVGLSLKFKGSIDFAKAFNTVKNVIDNANSIQKDIVGTANTVKDGAVSAANTVKDGTVSAANTVKDGAVSAAKKVGGFFKSLF